MHKIGTYNFTAELVFSRMAVVCPCGFVGQHFNANEYHPELLFEEETIVERVRDHPMALWKIKQEL